MFTGMNDDNMLCFSAEVRIAEARRRIKAVLDGGDLALMPGVFFSYNAGQTVDKACAACAVGALAYSFGRKETCFCGCADAAAGLFTREEVAQIEAGFERRGIGFYTCDGEPVTDQMVHGPFYGFGEELRRTSETQVRELLEARREAALAELRGAARRGAANRGRR